MHQKEGGIRADAEDVAAGRVAPDGEQIPGATGEASPDSQTSEDSFSKLLKVPQNANAEAIQTAVNTYLTERFNDATVLKDYSVVVLHDALSINREDADRIYKALQKSDKAKPILLVLSSPGGDVAAAYFIGKLCREHTDASFQVAVPREAKSAATLISCAADKIHMGSLSELGPIDPQIRSMPALAVKHSLEHLSEVASKYPGSQAMLSEYLAKSLPIEVLGYYERAAHSAVQYAERLLGARIGITSSPKENSQLAKKLVYDYKDHGFAIDHSEAATLFGNDAIARNTEEYEFANELYEELGFLKWFVGVRFDRDLAYTGGFGAGSWVRPKPQ